GANSPAGYRTGGVNYRVLEIPIGGIPEWVLVKNTDCSRIADPPAPVTDCTDLVHAATAPLTEQIALLQGDLQDAANHEAAHRERYYAAAQAAIPKPEAVP